jgi:two-component system chemotaxis response regulator CheB
VARRDIIVAGASAGGVEALSTLVSGLPPDLPAALCVVLHLPANGVSALPHILSRAGPLPAVAAENGMAIEHGRVYVAPPDCHLLLSRGHLRVTSGPKENGHRPALDPLFRSAARIYRRRVMGVVLSGALDDGTMGLAAIKMHGGVSIVQDPKDAVFPGMPASAAEQVEIDYCLPVAEIPGVLARLAEEDVPEEGGGSLSPEDEQILANPEPTMQAAELNEGPGAPSVYTCPECSGTLWEVEDGKLVHFRCRVGHAYSIESLMAEQSTSLETALWIALRSLEEKWSLAERMTERAQRQGHQMAAARFREQAREAAQSASIIRQAIEQTMLRYAESSIDPQPER